MSKQNDILNRMKSNKSRTGAETFLETMNEQVQENKQEPIIDNKTENFQENKQQQFNDHKTNQILETVNKTEQFIEHDNETFNKSVLERYSEKKTKEEMFTRQTYLIRNDLIERFDNAAKNRRKGFKTEVMNELLKNFLDENGL